MTKKLMQEVDRLKDTENRNADRIDRLSENIISLTVNVATLSSNISGFTSKIEGAEKLWNVQLSQLSSALQTATINYVALDKRMDDVQEAVAKRIDLIDDAMDVRVKSLEAAYQEARGSFKGAASIVMAFASLVGLIVMAAVDFVRH